MPKTYTPAMRRNLMATSATEPVLVALEIYHQDLEDPIRVVNDTVGLTVVVDDGDGNPIEIEFVACPFEIVLPDDVDQQIPSARLSVDNIGRELTQWLEYSGGGKGARCRILQITRSVNDQYTLEDFQQGRADITQWNPFEYDLLMDMTSMSIDNAKVETELGFFRTFGQAAVSMRYDPKTAPGMW